MKINNTINLNESKSWNVKFQHSLIFVVFFLIFTFPGSLQILKAPIFAVSLGLIVLGIGIKGKLNIGPVAMFFCLIFLIRGLWGTSIGIIKNTPGVYSLTSIYIYWVILYIIFLSQINNVKKSHILIKVIIIGSYIVALADILYVLQILNYLPSNINPFQFYYTIYEPYDYAFGFGYSHGKSIEFLAYNINLLFFSFPFLLTLLFLNENKFNSFWTKKSVLIILLLLNTLVVFLSNRKMLMVIILLSPFIISCLSLFLQKRERRRIFKYITYTSGIGLLFISIFLLKAASTLDIDIENLVYEFTQLSDDTEGHRTIQSRKLINYWWEAPLEGQGSGATVPGYSRGSATWAYELSYHLHLLQFGILGFLLEIVFYLGILYYGIKIIRKRNDIIMIALLAGYISFLLANATNPYCNSFDFLWPLFLPLAYINISLLDEKKKLIARQKISIKC